MTPIQNPKSKIQQSLAAYPLLLPTWLVLGVFFLLPLTILFVISFAQRGTYGSLKPIEDFGALPELREVSGQLRPVATSDLPADLLEIGLDGRRDDRALPGALLSRGAYYIAVTAPARRRNLLLGLVVIPFWTSFLIRTYAWMFLLRTEGLINRALLGTA